MNRQRSMMAGILTLLVIVMLPFTALAAFSSGSTGADGDFNPTTNTVLQIPESGVFNYGTVNIPGGVTVTFRKNSKNTPVTILASGDVTINGAISVSGGDGGTFLAVGLGGPGGFDGGVAGGLLSNGFRGMGPGGGAGAIGRPCCAEYAGCGGGGGFAGNGNNGATVVSDAPGGAGGSSYGNEMALPLIGGSGGGGGGGTSQYYGGPGGGGGGAILVASSGTITVNGSITANGGRGANGISPNACYWWGCGDTSFRSGGGGGGAGGSVRLIANTIAGNGTITATGGEGGYGHSYGRGGTASAGRIRLETWNFTRSAQTNPNFSVKWYPAAIAPTAMPTLAITSVGGVAVPAIVKGDTKTPDIQLPPNTTNPVKIIVSAANMPVGTTVTVKALSSLGNTVKSATGALVGTDSASTSTIDLEIPVAGYPSLLTVSATY